MSKHLWSSASCIGANNVREQILFMCYGTDKQVFHAHLTWISGSPPPCRTTSAAKGTLGTTALNAPGRWITGAPITAGVWTGCLAVGSVSVMRGSMAQPVKPAKLEDTAKTASQVLFLSYLPFLFCSVYC